METRMCLKTRPCSPDTHGIKEAESIVRMFALRNNMSRVLVLGDILLGWSKSCLYFRSLAGGLTPNTN